MRPTVLIFASLLLLCHTTLAKKKIVCYFTNSAIYRPGNGSIDISNIDPYYCTHLVYLIAGITNNGDLRVTDPNADLPEYGGRDGYRRFNEFHNQYVKTLIAVGGYNEDSTKFSQIAADPSLRKLFANNAVAFVKKYGFNGIDLEWMYPKIQDKSNYVLLLKELKDRFSNERLILAATHIGSQFSASSIYDIPQIVKYLDFTNIITYDLRGPWDRITGIHSPLYSGSWEYGNYKYLNVDTIVKYWISQGTPREKLILSIPTYGRSFTLDNAKNNGIGASASQPGYAGPYTRTPGFLGYNEICEEVIRENLTTFWQIEQKVPYIVNNNQWIGFENVDSVRAKTSYIVENGLGGAMVYTVDTDDFRGLCGRKFILLKAICAAIIE